MQYFALLLLFIIGLPSLSQNAVKTDTLKSRRELRHARQQRKIQEGRFMFFPIGAPASTPELGFLVALGGIPSFKTHRSDSIIQRSSVPMTIGVSSTGAVVAQALLSSYWFQDRMRIFADIWYKNLPDNYWGVGFQNAAERLESDSITAYDRKWWWFNPRVLYQPRKHYFIGVNIDFNYTQGSNPSKGVAADPDYNMFNNKPLNTGLGLIVRFDSRDVPVDARQGVLFDLRSTFYGSYLGGDNQYQVYQVDYRHFLPIHREGQTLTWQAKLRISHGAVPYGELSQLGTPFDLRGYTWGRYRDKDLFFILSEYRHIFLKRDRSLSRHSFVLWGGTGSVFKKFSFNNDQVNLIWNLGLGYRIEVQPRTIIRLDYGFGNDTTGFYFNFNQAF